MTDIQNFALIIVFCVSFPVIHSECLVDNCDPYYCSGDGCIKCEDGFYLLDTSCHPCQDSCTKCTSHSTCTECQSGRHGATCSSECKSECLECSSFSQCSSCIRGRYGSYCQHYCPLACIDIACEIDTGRCSLGCRHGYYFSQDECIECQETCIRCSNSSLCEECTNGFFGESCEQECPQGCANQRCDKESGTCTSGCRTGYFFDSGRCEECPYRCVSCSREDMCTQCQTGYWGVQCQNNCPLECLGCDNEGKCTDYPVCNIGDCDREFCWNNSCIHCDDGYYIDDNSCSECPTNCTKCKGPTDCTNCVQGRFGSQCKGLCRESCVGCSDLSECDSCVPGRWGSYCQFYCPLGCIDILCEKENGKCTVGCRHGFYKAREVCNICPSHCTRCSSVENCTTCDIGYYGSSCQFDCPSSCRNQMCDKDNGYCLDGCDVSFFQDENNCVACPDRCSSCFDITTCDACKTGYWGNHCEKDCPTTCFMCTQEGKCINESTCSVANCDNQYCIESSCIKCQNSYYLSDQSCIYCPEHCITCDGPSHCTQCSPGRYGSLCENTCKSTCLDCVSSTQCTSCIRGHHGLSCEHYCPLGCIDIECEKTSGRCIQGCRRGYFLSNGECSACPDTCTRCTDQSRCSNCVDGYYGTYCQYQCPSFCQNYLCDKISGACVEDCIDGYFSDGDSCDVCPRNCYSCSGPSVCTKCKTGFWGSQCQRDCPSECIACTSDGNCLGDPDCDISNCDREYCIGTSCIKCQDGFYLSGTHCFDCPSECTKCSGPSTCTECTQGRYGSECEYTCNSVCTDCISSSQCTSCIAGRHGSFCQFYCPLGCIDILCEKDSGTCTLGCRHGYYLSHDDCMRCPEHCSKCENELHCTGCLPGYFGSFCQYHCPDSCADQLCNKQSGFCTDGCKEGYFESNMTCQKCPTWCVSCRDEGECYECQSGRWGTRCQNDCPDDCYSCTRQGQCIDDGGVVCNIDHCEKPFCDKTSCIKCEDGYFLSGTHCYKCREHCTKCTSSTSCSECKIGRYGPQCEYTCSSLCTDCVSSSLCTSCIAGRYGLTCQSNCPLGCKNIVCDKDAGHCVDGCRRGFYPVGENCNQCPESCSACLDSNRCNSCNTGFFGSRCQWTCPQGCRDQLCHKDSGLCLTGCTEGYYYKENCIRCRIQCKACTSDENCTECKRGYYGQWCQHHCPNDCYSCTTDGQCIDFDGHECFIQNCHRAYCHENSCIKCQPGYYLYDTDCYECPSDCQECSSPSRCSRCKKGKYGNKCEYSCGSTCTDCVSSAECTSCIPGRYGATCHLYCPLGCKNILCDKTYGTCTEGCRHGYYLKNDNCLECPQPCSKCHNESYCTECQGGFHGDLCHKVCHRGCQDELCEIRSGNCTIGCAEDFHYHLGYCVEDVKDGQCLVSNCEVNNCFANTCARCKDGFYLEDFKCYRCPENCITCSSTDRCTICKKGRHGSVCQSECAVGCKDSVCSRDDGFCVEGCKEGYTLTEGKCKTCPDNCNSCWSLNLCSSCKVGFWGPTCQYNCRGCSTDGCANEANCTTGCRDGYYAQPVQMVRDAFECLKCSENCSTCTISRCTKCLSGHWGDLCENECSANCKSDVCDQYKEDCLQGCENGFYGATCSNACSTRCESCDNSDDCTVCAAGRHGVACEQSCSPHCFRYYCDRQNGTCIYGCSAGYAGEICSQGIRCQFAISPKNHTCNTVQSTGPAPQYNTPNTSTNTGLAIGLAIVAAIAVLVITLLTIKIFRIRKAKERVDESKVPPVMNQTYDTRIGTADFYAGVRERSRPYENTNTIITEATDRDLFDISRRISNYPAPTYSGSDKDYYEEAEYSSIKSSIDNIASF